MSVCRSFIPVPHLPRPIQPYKNQPYTRRKTLSCRPSKMRASALAFGCLALEALGAIGATDHLLNLERVFQERSKADWENAWHRETHARCRETLLRHLYWACEKDIYGVSRRSVDVPRPPRPPWVSGWKAKGMLRYRRDIRRRSPTAVSSITQECCAGPGCTWEEYAEYCPANKRVDKRISYIEI